MKKLLSMTTLAILLLILSTSCKTASYTPSYDYSPKLPTLNPELDWLSVETNISDGKTVSSSYSYGAAMSNNRNTALGFGVTNTESQYIKNPAIKELRDLFINETHKISEKFGESQGSIVWSINRYSVKKSKGGLLFILPPLGILYLAGVPFSSATAEFEIKVDILNKNKSIIASYSAYSKKKYHKALYWGYYNPKKLAYNNAMVEVINEIKDQIMLDRDKIMSNL